MISRHIFPLNMSDEEGNSSQYTLDDVVNLLRNVQRQSNAEMAQIKDSVKSLQDKVKKFNVIFSVRDNHAISPRSNLIRLVCI